MFLAFGGVEGAATLGGVIGAFEGADGTGSAILTLVADQRQQLQQAIFGSEPLVRNDPGW